MAGRSPAFLFLVVGQSRDAWFTVVLWREAIIPARTRSNEQQPTGCCPVWVA
jgi:hypothetical protein